jgi:VanZ family protein
MKIRKINILLLAWIILMFAAIAWPSSHIPKEINSGSVHTIAHLVMFSVLTFLIYRYLTDRRLSQRSATIMSFFGALMYAGFTEIFQIFMPGRNCSMYGIFIDVLGSVIALTAILFRKKWTMDNGER